LLLALAGYASAAQPELPSKMGDRNAERPIFDKTVWNVCWAVG
jgi:hypothetical protein